MSYDPRRTTLAALALAVGLAGLMATTHAGGKKPPKDDSGGDGRTYRVVDLGGARPSANAVNDAGVIVGATDEGATYWSVDAEGNVQMAHLPDSGLGSSASDVNSLGDAVGTVGGQAALWRDVGAGNPTLVTLGTLREPAPGNTAYSGASAISESGLIVGYSYEMQDDTQQFLWGRAVLWQPDGNGGFEVVELPSPDLGATATDVNNVGQVIGSIGSVYGVDQVVWQLVFDATGKVIRAEAPIPFLGTRVSEIDDTGTICGEAPIGEAHKAVLWKLTYDANGRAIGVGEPIDLGNLPRMDLSLAPGFNHTDAGGVRQVVGESQVWERHFGVHQKPFLWENGTMTDLNDLLADKGGFDSLRWASGINEAGWITGGGSKGKKTPQLGAYVALPLQTESGGNTAESALEVAPDPTEAIVTDIDYGTTGAKGKHLIITVEARDDLGRPVAGASVFIQVYLDGQSYDSPTGPTGEDGTVTFLLKNAPSGEYETTVSAVDAGALIWDGVTPPNSFIK